MRKKLPAAFDQFRLRDENLDKYGTEGVAGVFQINALRMVSSPPTESIAQGWEHVSVSCEDRCPTWDEMCAVKNIFWEDHECVVQFHPPKSDYINCHPFVLHLWRPTRRRDQFRLPPKVLV